MQNAVSIRPVELKDSAAWEQMREALWPSASGEHASEIAKFFSGNHDITEEVLVACNESGELVGFVELSIRSHAEGCSSHRIAYLEGWFITPSARRKGIGKILVEAAEQWGRTQGCCELASDTEIENHTSIAAHQSLGFSEVTRSNCFRKTLQANCRMKEIY
ncbi:MAG: GNAT family N-acetyltransferase [Ignavibacteriales bacterium]|nr:GNAT family N-acetyltransferase [Ignavibacteriales bacterium]